MTTAYLLDTNIVSAVLKKDSDVLQQLRNKLRANCRIMLSAVVYYEIKRGLLKRDAMRQLTRFEEMARRWMWLDVEPSHWNAAARQWAVCQKSGIAVNDADILLAVQARLTKAVVVTNDGDFDHLDVEHEDWIALTT